MADYIYLLVRSGKPDERYKNLSVILLPTDTPGVTFESIGTMGGHGLPTNDVILDNVEVSATNILGGVDMWNKGWSLLAGPALEAEKLEVPAMALGIAEGRP